MATSIIVKGKRKSTPGVYTKVDASQLNARGPGPIGVVALIGTAEGGMPVTSSTHPDDFIRLTSADQVLSTFRSGDLREAAMIAFNPANDELVPSGAAEIYCMKVNQALQSSADLSAALGTVLTLTSVDYGEFANQINATVATGTSTGKKLTTVFGATSEVVDNVGGEDIFEINYEEDSISGVIGGGWETMVLQVLSSGIKAWGTWTETGLATDITAGISGGAVACVTSGADNVGKYVRLYGLDADGNPVSEVIGPLINGGAGVTGTQTWSLNKLLGAVVLDTDRTTIAAAASQDIVVHETNSGGTTLITLAQATSDKTKGVYLPTNMLVGKTSFQIESDGSDTGPVIIWGRTLSGATLSEKVTLSGTGGKSVATTATTWAEIDVIVAGDVLNAQSLTITGVAAQTTTASHATLQAVADYFNARDGFTFTILTGETEMSPGDLDLISGAGTNIYGTTAVGFTADLKAVIDAWNDSSELVTAERIDFVGKTVTLDYAAVNGQTYTITINGTACSYTADSSATEAEIAAGLIAAVDAQTEVARLVSATSTGTGAATQVVITALTPADFTYALTNMTVASATAAVGVGSVPSNVSNAFLTGGSEGATPGTTEWTNAINRLKQIRVNHVVPLTGNSAYHALVKTFCVNQDGVNEATAFVGVSGTGDGDLPTKSELKTAIRNLNSKFVQVCGQSIDRFNTSGVRETFMPWFQAAQLAGVRAGSPLGLPSTHKYVDCLSFTQDSSWNPVDDSDELIQAGCVFYETVPNVGIRIVRDITSYLKDDNLAYIEGAVVHEINLFAYEFRRAMEWIVGRPGFPGTVTSAVTAAKGFCLEKVRDGSITDFETPTATLSGDRLAIAVAILPTLPINFVPTTIYLRAAEFTA